MKFESLRLSYSPMAKIDFDFFYQLDSDPEVMKFIRRPSAGIEEARERFDRLLNYSTTFPDRGAFLVRSRDGNAIGLGFIIHIELDPANPDHEVGYRLSRDAWGKGYATEIAGTLIKYAFEEMNLSTVYATTNPAHVVSQKVLLRVGMEEQGSASYYGGCRFFKMSRSGQKF